MLKNGKVFSLRERECLSRRRLFPGIILPKLITPCVPHGSLMAQKYLHCSVWHILKCTGIVVHSVMSCVVWNVVVCDGWWRYTEVALHVEALFGVQRLKSTSIRKASRKRLQVRNVHTSQSTKFSVNPCMAFGIICNAMH